MFLLWKGFEVEETSNWNVSGALDMFVEVFFFKRGEGKFEVNLARMKRKREREGGREKEREEEIFCRKFIFGYFVCICI